MLKYILIGVGILFILWLLAAIKKISSSVKSGEFQRALDAKKTLRELNRDVELSPEDAQQFMQEYVAEHSAKASTPINATPDKPEVNARYSWWLAIKSDSADEVVSALHVSEATPCNWKTGSEIISSSMSNKTFAGSSIDGWVLLFGLLPEPDEGSPESGLWELLLTLSKRFGAAQYFSCSTGADFYSWAKAETGNMVRAFSVAGETIAWNHGTPTPAEVDAGFTLEGGVVGPTDGVPNPEQLYDVENPLTISRSWSVCPEDLYNRDDLAPAVGLLFTIDSLELN